MKWPIEEWTDLEGVSLGKVPLRSFKIYPAPPPIFSGDAFGDAMVYFNHVMV